MLLAAFEDQLKLNCRVWRCCAAGHIGLADVELVQQIGTGELSPEYAEQGALQCFANSVCMVPVDLVLCCAAEAQLDEEAGIVAGSTAVSSGIKHGTLAATSSSAPVGAARVAVGNTPHRVPSATPSPMFDSDVDFEGAPLVTDARVSAYAK